MVIIKTLFVIIGLFCLIFSVIPILTMRSLNSGNYMGFAIAALFLGYGFFSESINSAVTVLQKSIYGVIMLTVIGGGLLFGFVFALVVTANILLCLNKRAKTETTVIVLGCRVRRDGQSTVLNTRLKAAYDYLTAHGDARCILSGGQGNDEPVAESRYLYDRLVEMGIDKERLYIEDRSTTTEENIKLSKIIIEKHGLPNRVTVITSGFHQYRAHRFAKQNGLEPYSHSARTPFHLLFIYYIREICGVAHMIFIG